MAEQDTAEQQQVEPAELILLTHQCLTDTLRCAGLKSKLLCSWVDWQQCLASFLEHLWGVQGSKEGCPAARVQVLAFVAHQSVQPQRLDILAAVTRPKSRRRRLPCHQVFGWHIKVLLADHEQTSTCAELTR